MTLYLDNFSITGHVDEIIDFLKKYNTKTTVTGNIGDLYTPRVGISSFDDPNHIWEHHGKHFDTIDLNDLSDAELREIAINNHLDKDVDLETLTRPELILLVGDIQSACSTNRNI